MALEAFTDESAGGLPAELVQVGVYPTYASGSEHGLVVLAMGLPYWLVPSADRFALFVEPAATEAVREQLARFDRESLRWPPAPPEIAGIVRPLDFGSSMVWAALLLGAFYAQARWPELIAIGALDAGEVFSRGELWRPFTALWLHADLGHVTSNLVSGLFVFAAVASTFGRRTGWLLIAGAAVLGNFAAAAAQLPEPYRSVGASTAIFGGLGLLTGRAIRRTWRSPGPRRYHAIFVPLFAGYCLLALYGADGLRVDLGAHLCGFVAGLLLGAGRAGDPTAGATPVAPAAKR